MKATAVRPDGLYRRPLVLAGQCHQPRCVTNSPTSDRDWRDTSIIVEPEFWEQFRLMTMERYTITPDV
jgi:hypothetical protein